MQSFQIICHFCGHNCYCPIPIGIKDKALPYHCNNCSAHLGEFIDIENKEIS